MNLIEVLAEKSSSIKHSPRDILLFVASLACAVNLYLYFQFLDSGDKTQIVINTSSEGEVAGESSRKIPVYISGAVNFPGVYFLDSGSLIADAVKSAGGFSSTANVIWLSKSLNLSGVLDSNSRVYIPFSWDTDYALNTKIINVSLGETSPNNDDLGFVEGVDVNNNAGKVNVNTASLAQLDELPGIGPVYAQRIADNRPYQDFDDFKLNSGLSENLANSLSEHVRFN